ncbi:MAG TPA: chemotaxis protein CheW [Peptococcaceae bacterium]|jgi:purine-binding chemotaxis protein CheW|nr:purine-binding chemotaxis protein CheW [Clostridia bacterium]HOB82467.1 chemotaxis protein CheW [Peptococcaceae bacterium]HQD53539.1 chemotaxis protein CheW [Peptococcaceae bacterium]
MYDSIIPDALDTEDTLKGKYLTFFLGEECYGIEIRYVIEIIGIQGITEIPELPAYIKGIINLRGQIIPVMDMRMRFRRPFKEYNDRTCVVVVVIKNVSLGLIVDNVADVIDIPDEEIVPPPNAIDTDYRFVKGISKMGGQIRLLLECEKILGEDEAEELVSSINQL